MSWKNRIAALVASFGVALALLVGAPAGSGQDAARADGETFRVTFNSDYGTRVLMITKTGGSYIGVLPGGRVTFTGRLHQWYLPRGRCATLVVNGVHAGTRMGTNFVPWVWIPYGGSVTAYIFRARTSTSCY